MLSRSLLLLLPLISTAYDPDERVFANGYSYDRCNETARPGNWPGLCSAHIRGGTPIDLCGAVPFPDGAPMITTTGYDQAVPMNIKSGSGSITVTATSTTRPTVSVEHLSFLVGMSPNETATWALEQMHLHWGRYNMTDEGSEHYKQGMAYAAEAHFVHYNTKYGSFGDAVGSGATDALLVIGVFLEESTSDVPAIQQISNQALTVSSTPVNIDPLNFDALINTNGTYYSYGGGLTTPTCLEIVTWVVMDAVSPISLATLERLWNLEVSDGSSEKVGEQGNYRPLQSRMNRTVYKSSGTSAACTTVTEPAWDCDASSSVGAGAGSAAIVTVPSLLLPISLFFFVSAKLL